MTPYPKESNSNGQGLKVTGNEKNGLSNIKSSFPGINTYTGIRGLPFPNVFDWLEVKRRDDNIGKNYWRVHDKLYNLADFIDKHPGGSDWIDFTKGTDITEAFESSHVVNIKKVEQILSKYYVKDAEGPRNSPYTFKANGFYRTLKCKIEPILQEVGIDSTPKALLIQDSLAAVYAILAFISVSWDFLPLQILAGLVLGMCIVGAHNFFHKKDNWRRFYYDLGPLSSYEWRISHAFSHHMYPNTILVQKYMAIFYIEPLYCLYGISQIIVRVLGIVQGKQKFRPENLIILIELGIFLMIAPSFWSGFQAWLIIFMAASFWFIVISNNSAHHHPECFHDGDEARLDPDFGLCQLDATRGKSDWYHKPLLSVLTTFGEHPLHHLFPTICHSKLQHIKESLHETLQEFSEEFPEFTQLELFLGTHKQITRTVSNPLPIKTKVKQT